MLHSALHPAFSGMSGTGIIASRDIDLGTAVWGPCATCHIWDGARLGATVPAVVEWLNEYGYRLSDGKVILPCMGAHLLNHSCNASVLDYGLSVGIAVRDIKAGEEVTIDYRTFRHELPWEFACSCGTPTCVETVRFIPGAVPANLTDEWRERMAPALERARNIPQEIPLREGGVVLGTLFSNCVNGHSQPRNDRTKAEHSN